MTLSVVIAVAVGAGLGAPLRFLVERGAARLLGPVVPWGTLVVNVVGSLILGAVLGLAVAGGISTWWVALVGTGFCGALTTFSGFSAQVLDLGRQGGGGVRGVAYATGSLVLGVAAATAGYALLS
ncbi:MAG: fluoride efflux transporter CrcB [Actinobacteria bacterium]|uniref:Unannotated protein n=1 Tax=freshwater metagenome TaxID=449393 RepID=A0A6J7RCN3_9ZZZZ|nr:fluoride efflux transporter CrcB [Actinomycetota bacterium]